jgi:hypothetical protein
MKFVVSTNDLRQALTAVLPHIDPDKDAQQLHRLRVEVGRENVTVSATNRFTAAHALVSVWENEDGEVGPFDLSPTNAKEILALFKGKPGTDDEPGETLRVEVDDKHLTVTDISGLFAGKALTVPRQPDEENFPNIPQLLAAKLNQGPASTERLVTSGQLLGLFTKAAAAYGHPLVIDPAGDRRSPLISCGESFIGMLAQAPAGDELTAQINGWHTAWLDRLAEDLFDGSES